MYYADKMAPFVFDADVYNVQSAEIAAANVGTNFEFKVKLAFIS